MGSCVVDWSLGAWGGSVLVMERIRCMSCPDWSLFVVGWQRIFFHVVLGGMVGKQIGWPLMLVDWGAGGV